MRFTNVKSLLARGAQMCEQTQRRILELEYAPNQSKQLRLFPTSEAATILGLSDSHLRALVRDRADFPKGKVVAGNNHRAFTLEEIHVILRTLYAETGDARYRRGRSQTEPLQVVAVANFKGGVAKTTTAVHLAQYLALRGYRVLILDLDSQGSLSNLFGLQPDVDVEPEATLYPLFRGDLKTIETLPRKTHWPSLDLIPASLALYQSEFELPVRRELEKGLEFWRVLEYGIFGKSLPYDVIVCDCPPSLGFLSINAMFAATGVLVPVPPAMMDFASTGAFFRMSYDVLDQLERFDPRGKEYAFFKVLITKCNTADQAHTEISKLMAANFGDLLLDERMAVTTMMDVANLHKQTLYEIDPAVGARRTHQRALAFLNKLNHEIEGLLWKAWGRSTAPAPVAAAAA
jgi:chromosome partitioning protein